MLKITRTGSIYLEIGGLQIDVVGAVDESRYSYPFGWIDVFFDGDLIFGLGRRSPKYIFPCTIIRQFKEGISVNKLAKIHNCSVLSIEEAIRQGFSGKQTTKIIRN